MYGYLTKPGITFNDTKTSDLSKLSIIELKDILERQDKLLSNGKFINSLPDKGKKIKDYQQKVLEKLKSKELVEQTTSILAKLNLNQKVDLQHPMASGSGIVTKSNVDPYAQVLSQALDETLPKSKVTKFMPKKSKDELKKETIKLTTPELLKITKDSESNTLESTTGQSVSMDIKPNVLQTTTNQLNKSRAEKIVEKYKDTGLVYGPREIQLQELSVDESLALSKNQIEKEKQVNIIRRVERTIKFYENIDQGDISDESDHHHGESDGDADDDDKGTTIVFKYMK
ncbi:DNA-directed RNA polymerase II subunit GRINL1A-like [Panonychus citri]|uniref:DNA-directed RNA polymerase II subunit GRINL1A-like n=2 Tax=Panonychus citri TaxID=50023 RepID=UPI002307BFEC|nr:DNA-directed RNA polymerase II subunit GRINL1A-like [Panonychus citri]